MSLTVAPVTNDIYVAVKAFIVSVLGSGVPVIQGLGNRAAMPLPGFVAMTIILQNRLATTIDSWDPTDPAPTGLSAQQSIQVTVQLDCYGPLAPDWAAMLTTLWRDDYGCQVMAPNCQPLYADEARQIPLIDSESQYESRMSITATLEYDPITSYPMQFADTLVAGLINVDVVYPAS